MFYYVYILLNSHSYLFYNVTHKKLTKGKKHILYILKCKLLLQYILFCVLCFLLFCGRYSIVFWVNNQDKELLKETNMKKIFWWIFSENIHGNCTLYPKKKRATAKGLDDLPATLTYIHLGFLTMNIWQPHRKKTQKYF